jgi:hypothetical protein
MVCLIVIMNPRKLEGLGPQGMLRQDKKKSFGMI